MKATFFNNGNVMFFDDNGKQVPELQAYGWFGLYIKRVVSLGLNPEDIEFTMPNGQTAKPFKGEDGWNWTLR